MHPLVATAPLGTPHLGRFDRALLSALLSQLQAMVMGGLVSLG